MALNGDFSDLSLSDLLYLFEMRGMTGRLTLQTDQDDALLYFQRGKLVFVTSSRVSQHLGQLLIQQGRLTVEQLGLALAFQATAGPNQTLGEILVNQGWVTADEINTFVTLQAEEILYRVLAWPNGTFSFSSSPTAPLGMPIRDLNMQQIILEATRRADEAEAIRARVPSLDCGLLLLHDPATTGLNGTLRLKSRIVIASIMQGAVTVREVIAATGLIETEVLQLINSLVIHEAVAITPPTLSLPMGPAPGDPPSLLAPHRPGRHPGRLPAATGD